MEVLMLEEKSGWYVLNVKDARWVGTPDFGKRCRFEKEQRFPQTGIGISLLEPGKPNCRYHRESAQEDFLVLSGECLLLVNGEERKLKAWDYVHCPAGVSHVFVGAGDGPCALLCIGHRPENLELFYPKNELAQSHGAETPEATPDPRVAYSDVQPLSDIETPKWPQ
jgi:uncharacterized cupin superfamily protein